MARPRVPEGVMRKATKNEPFGVTVNSNYPSNLSRRNFMLATGLALVGLGAPGCATNDSDAAQRSTASDSIYETALVDDKREITINGIANHDVGKFPTRSCPNKIQEISGRFFVAANPSENAYLTPLNGWLFGIASSGVPFDPNGPFWRDGIWEFEVMSTIARPFLGLDASNAHVQPNGAYHYHGIPHGLVAVLQSENVAQAPVQLGWAADGFPIYGPWGYVDPLNATSRVELMHPSYRLKTGTRPPEAPSGTFDGSFVQDYEYVARHGHLDECNGRFGVVPEYPMGIYHYYLTEKFPFISRFYRGTPNNTFAHPKPGPDALPPALYAVGF